MQLLCKTWLYLLWFLPMFVSSQRDEINKTLQFIAAGWRTIEQYEKHTDITLVIGNTGAGKSAFTQWLAGDPNCLEAVDISDGDGEFIVQEVSECDQPQRIGSETTVSYTIVPELVVDKVQGAAFYDCPGFSDTRNASYDIAATYFVQKLTSAKHVRHFKIVLIAEYMSMQVGLNRQRFMDLLRHTTNMIKDIWNFRNSIAIVVTKVENFYSGGILTDAQIVRKIERFLETVRAENVGGNSSSIIQLIDILLMNNGTDYNRIGFFRRPTQAGRLSEMALLESAKERNQQMIYNKLQYKTKINDDDLGYTLAEKSKNYVNKLDEKIIEVASSDYSIIFEKIEDYFRNMAASINKLVNSARINNTESKFLGNKLTASKRALKSLFTDINNTTSIKKISEIYRKITDTLKIQCHQQLESLAILGDLLHFLQIAANNELDKFDWLSYTKSKNGLSYLSKFTTQISDQISNAKQIIGHKIYCTSIDITNEIKRLAVNYYAMSNFTKALTNVSNVLVLSKELKKEFFNSTIIIHNAMSIHNYGKYLESLNVLQNDTSMSWSPSWVYPFEKITKYFGQLIVWDAFLKKLHARLSKYDVQTNCTLFNDIRIDRNNFGSFFSKIEHLQITGFDVVKLMTTSITAQQLQDLNLILFATVKSAWIIPFENIIAKSDQQPEVWYRFLNSIFVQFSTYLVHKNMQNSAQQLNITLSNLQLFMKRIKSFGIEEYDRVKSWNMSAVQLSEFNEILQFVLTAPVIECNKPDRLLIKGNYVMFSQFVDTAGVIQGCDEFTIKSVEIYALHTVFIDRDINGIGQRFQMTIIAPNWVVTNPRVINLSGAIGAEHVPAKAGNGDSASGRGFDGLPGLAGGPGGNFLGVGVDFNHVEWLTIASNGGRGGDGQAGGDGAAGRDAFAPDFLPPDQIGTQSLPEPSLTLMKYNFTWMSTQSYISNNKSLGSLLVLTTVKEFNVFGTDVGDRGGDGGNGGRRGLGGRSGNITVIALNGEPNWVVTQHEQGVDGQDGHGGDGGQGGETNQTLSLRYTVTCTTVNSGNTTMKMYDGSWSKLESVPPIRVESGTKGRNGGNGVALTPAAPERLQSISKAVNHFKKYMRASANKMRAWLPFIQLLEDNRHIRDIKDIRALIGEFFDIEDQFYKTDLEFFALYKTLLMRLREVKCTKPLCHKALGYFHSAISSKLTTMWTYQRSPMNVDIALYLDTVITNMKLLRVKQKHLNKFDLIKESNRFYTNAIHERTKEAMHFVTTKISPNINRVHKEIYRNLDSLFNETTVLLTEAHYDPAPLIRKQQEFKIQLINWRMLKHVEIIEKIISCFGHVGAAYGLVITQSTNIAEALMSEREAPKPIQLGNDMSKSVTVMYDTIKAAKFDTFCALLKNFTNQLDTSGLSEGLLRNISFKVKKLLSQCESDEKTLQYDVAKVQKLQDDLQDTLLNEGKNIKSVKAKRILKCFNQDLQFSKLGLDTYDIWQKDKKRVDAIQTAVDTILKESRRLDKFEIAIFEKITPLLKRIEDDLHNIILKLHGNAHIFMDTTQWQVKSLLKVISLHVKQFTKRFAIHDSLLRCSEELQEAMISLAIIYDSFQSYQEQMRLVTYLADISKPTMSERNIDDQEQDYAIAKLDHVITRNLVLQQYRVVVNAMDQQQFPFPNKSITIILNKNLQEVVDQAVEGIEEMQLTIKQNKTEMEQLTGSYRLYESFNRLTSRPFFVWDNYKYRESIAKFLSGEMITVKADVKQSAIDKHAIKFNSISIDFHTLNATITAEISNKLNGFMIRARHLGNSYYRYNDNIYMITCNSQTFEFSYRKDATGEPVNKNSVYSKIHGANLMLSPYGWWELQLVNTTNDITFEDLVAYKDDVSVALEGKGSYLTKSTNSSDVNLHAYYYKVGEDQNDVDAVVLTMMDEDDELNSATCNAMS